MYALVSLAEFDEYIHFMTTCIPHFSRERATQAFFREVGTTRIVHENQLADDPYWGDEDSPFRYVHIPEEAGYCIKLILSGH